MPLARSEYPIYEVMNIILMPWDGGISVNSPPSRYVELTAYPISVPTYGIV